MSLVKKILVANRGEIACRIIRTAKRYNIPYEGLALRPWLSTQILTVILSSWTWQIRLTELATILQLNRILINPRSWKSLRIRIVRPYILDSAFCLKMQDSLNSVWIME